jgi:hypothetical protein
MVCINILKTDVFPSNTMQDGGISWHVSKRRLSRSLRTATTEQGNETMVGREEGKASIMATLGPRAATCDASTASLHV